MSEELKVLLNIRSLRAAAREYPLEQLKDALSKLTTVVTEREEHEAEDIAKEKEREEKLNQYREMLLAEGIDPGELLSQSGAKKAKSKRAARPPKGVVDQISLRINDAIYDQQLASDGHT
ncbi:H-NS family histone-like protein, partial [Photobacterium sp. R1]